jgi:hypothetical protein
MADDLEDNIFLSRESGYGVVKARERFFHLGGFTLQPTLVDLCLTYLERDEVPAFLRAFWNTAWASLYPDVLCFAEWVPQLGKGGGPLYKTPDECKFIQWMRYQLILERDGGLELGLGVPRAWMAPGKRVRVAGAATLFGRLDLEIAADGGGVVARVNLKPSVRPRFVRIRLRHTEGRPIRSATANGSAATVDASRQLVELPAETCEWEVRGSF